MDMEFDKVKQALADINILNVGKKRDEALASLANWIPEAEKFTAQLHNVDEYIRELKCGNKAAEEYMGKENRMLQGRVAELDKSYIRSQHEVFELREALRKQKRLLDRVPKEVLENLSKLNSRESKQR